MDIHYGFTQFLNNPPSTDVGLRREWVFLPPALNGSQKHQSAAKDVVTMSCDVQVNEMPLALPKSKDVFKNFRWVEFLGHLNWFLQGANEMQTKGRWQVDRRNTNMQGITSKPSWSGNIGASCFTMKMLESGTLLLCGSHTCLFWMGFTHVHDGSWGFHII